MDTHDTMTIEITGGQWKSRKRRGMGGELLLCCLCWMENSKTKWGRRVNDKSIYNTICMRGTVNHLVRRKSVLFTVLYITPHDAGSDAGSGRAEFLGQGNEPQARRNAIVEWEWKWKRVVVAHVLKSFPGKLQLKRLNPNASDKATTMMSTSKRGREG